MVYLVRRWLICAVLVCNTIFYFSVEDSTVNRRLLDRMLFRLGYNSVVHACDGLDALNKANQTSTRFDIVLLDLSMPGMDGLSLLSHLLEHGRPASLVCIPLYPCCDIYIYDLR